MALFLPVLTLLLIDEFGIQTGSGKRGLATDGDMQQIEMY